MYSENFIDEFIMTCESFIDYEAEYEFDGNTEIEDISTEGLKEMMKTVGGAIAGAFKTIGQWIRDRWSDFMKFIGKCMDTIREKIRLAGMSNEEKSKEAEVLITQYVKDLDAASASTDALIKYPMQIIIQVNAKKFVHIEEVTDKCKEFDDKISAALTKCSEAREKIGYYKGLGFSKALLTGLKTAITTMSSAKDSLIKTTNLGEKFIEKKLNDDGYKAKHALSLALTYTKKTANALGQCMEKASSIASRAAKVVAKTEKAEGKKDEQQEEK